MVGKFKRILFWIFFLGIFLDQGAKILSEKYLMTYSDSNDHRLYKGSKYQLLTLGELKANESYLAVNINYVRNPGAVWGSFHRLSEELRLPFFYLATIFSIILILFFLYKNLHQSLLTVTSLVLVLSGALGNAIDRVRLGYVIDWIDIRWNFLSWKVNFPNFNFADILIIFGLIVVLLEMIKADIRKKLTQEK